MTTTETVMFEIPPTKSFVVSTTNESVPTKPLFETYLTLYTLAV